MVKMSFTVVVEVENYNKETDTGNANIYMKTSDNYPKSEEHFEALEGEQRVAASLTNELIGDYLDVVNSRGDTQAMTETGINIPKTIQ